MNQPRFQVRNLQHLHLRIDQLDIAAGSCVGLSGVSGTGKTLLLRALADLDQHQGDIKLDGLACEQFVAPQWRCQVAYLMAENVWWHDRVADHFVTPPEPKWLAAMALDEAVLTRAIARLSTGERQRLAILRLLANRPKVLLLDEPTASLDPGNVRRIEQLIADYRRSQLAAVLWVSHDPQQISRVADRSYVLVDGCLQESAPWR